MMFGCFYLLILSCNESVTGFSSTTYSFSLYSSTATQRREKLPTALRSTVDDEISKLRAAAAKAREEADKLSQEIGRDVTNPTTVVPKKSKDEFKELLPSLVVESNLTKQAEQWSELKSSKTVVAFGQANLRTYPVSLQMLEQRTGLSGESLGLEVPNVNMDDFKYATLFVLAGSAVGGVLSLALLPPNVGATFCYLFALLPVLFLGIGSSVPELIANAIGSIKGEQGEKVPPEERICRHEAAHFCCGYWCALPISGYSVLDGVARVEFGAPSSKFTSTEIAALAVTGMAGLAGEATEWGKAQGAQADLMQLDGIFRQAEEFIGAAQQQDITRWGALTAANLLKTNKEKYENVVEAFRRRASVQECIEILESE